MNKQPDSQPVFYDPEGRRGPRIARWGAVIGIIFSILATVFFLGALLSTPDLQDKRRPSPTPFITKQDTRRANLLAASNRKLLNEQIAKDRLATKVPSSNSQNIVMGFYAPWEEAGLSSLRQNASKMTHVAPEWLHLTSTGEGLDFSDFDLSKNPKNVEVIEIARQNGVKIIPIFSNGENGKFDLVRLKKMFSSVERQTKVATALKKWVLDHGFSGINLDFENLDGDASKKLGGFLEILQKQFRSSKLEISIDIEATNDELPIKEIGSICDLIVLMVYDYHSEDGMPGPISPASWGEKTVRQSLSRLPKEKLVMGIGSYAYDWIEGKPGAENLSYQDALTAAHGYRNDEPRKVIQFDPESFNNWFEYDDDDEKRHVVWMLDGVSAFNQWRIGQEFGVRGSALWVLGAEDPSVWTFLDHSAKPRDYDPKRLETIQFPYQISFTGKGEILTVKSTPQEGQRTIQVDPASGLIGDCIYDKYAFPYVLQKRGFKPKKLCLTLDDGPDPQWSPKILDTLKELNVKATFFVLGDAAEQHPGLVARMYREGHEVGSHSFLHPNMGTISTTRAKLELNLTQMAIESIIGRSTILFRPPYNADSQPETDVQVRPVILADEMGYVTVAENIDPTDWDLKVPVGDGLYRRKTAQDIADYVINDIETRQGTEEEGNVILLHDAGGDRSATVDALKMMVPRLRDRGYEFVQVSDLMDTTRDKLMPEIRPQDRLMYYVSKAVMGTAYTALSVIATCFTLAIYLGVARVALMVPLALLQRREEGKVVDAEFSPTVSVIIAAYNEQNVIVRTIESILEMSYPITEIIVVNDGSQDETGRVLVEAFNHNPIVRIVDQPNGGKASALNNGISLSVGEILLCIDADTQLHPDSLKHLVHHFADPKVGAVAGSVRVGNEVNIITRWQSLEYATSQNLDRRAYSLVNAITVVPGAIGAWRRTAVSEVGGYLTDTLAEDMDLTWRLRRAGFRQVNEPRALAFTEAPDSFRGFFNQRFRWAYGTLQCLCKHKRALFSSGWFGWFALPTLWLFQIVFQAIAPMVDLQIFLSLLAFLFSLITGAGGGENASQAFANANATFVSVGAFYLLFFGVELLSSAIALKLEGRSLKLLWWLFFQRFAYRQMMYGVIYKSIGRALRGGRQGWGKLERKGTVKIQR